MKTDLEWIDETPGVIMDDEHKQDLMKLYREIQSDALREAAEIAGSGAIREPSAVDWGVRLKIRDAILAKVKDLDK